MTRASESRHMGRVAELGCVVCRNLGYGDTPAQVHHIREGVGAAQRAAEIGNVVIVVSDHIREGVGAAQRAPHWLTIPFCPERHTGQSGYHPRRAAAFERMYGATELDLLDQTLDELYGCGR